MSHVNDTENILQSMLSVLSSPTTLSFIFTISKQKVIFYV